MYFVTICTQNRIHYFGEISEGEMQLSQIGEMADKYWHEIPEHFPFVVLDEFVVMPDHIHGIINIDKPINCNGDLSNDNFGSPIETQDFASLRPQPKNKFGPQSKSINPPSPLTKFTIQIQHITSIPKQHLLDSN